ncbi:unnamed protein product [Ilex paraguariensis]|uniref:WW domain-containing protein n=1 Tax=Ilex paraguariensis TaxID=185542 RepID=A0ABC8RLJ2_9AQUA
MESPAWIPQEVQSSTSQASACSPPVGTAGMGPSTPTAAPVMSTPTSKGESGTASDSMPESAQAKFANASGIGIPLPSFSYNVLANANSSLGHTQQSSSSPVIKSNSPGSLAFLQPPVPGLSSSVGPSFSYYVSHAGAGSASGQQLQSSMPIASGHSQGGKNTPSSAASLQPPVPGHFARSNSFVPGTAAQIMPSLVPAPAAVPQGAPSNSVNFSFSGNSQSMQKDQSLKSNMTAGIPQETRSILSAPSTSQSVSQTAHASSSSATTVSTRPETIWMPNASSFQVPPGMSGTPVMPGPPGIAPPSIPFPSNVTFPSALMDSSSSAVVRPIMPTASVSSNSAVQQQAYPPYPSVPPLAAPPQGLWLQPSLIGGLQRPAYLPYPASFPGPFLSAAHGTPLPSVALPDSQPPGVNSVGPPGGTPTSSAASNIINSGTQPELFRGAGNSTLVNDGINDGAVVGEQLDAWTAHWSETGAVYYYNALTGESTYEKPAGFKREPDKVTAQPTPVSWMLLVIGLRVGFCFGLSAGLVLDEFMRLNMNVDQLGLECMELRL